MQIGIYPTAVIVLLIIAAIFSPSRDLRQGSPASLDRGGIAAFT